MVKYLVYGSTESTAKVPRLSPEGLKFFGGRQLKNQLKYECGSQSNDVLFGSIVLPFSLCLYAWYRK
jgi:hypothetical protein